MDNKNDKDFKYPGPTEKGIKADRELVREEKKDGKQVGSGVEKAPPKK